MKTQFGDDIRYSDPHRHKYDSAMAEYLDGLDADESTGDVDWHGHVSRFGKRLLHHDDRGFVSVERYPTVAAAVERFEVIDAEYGAWLDLSDDDDDSDSFLFFMTHAGSSYRPGVETEETGRRRGAADLVRAERWARATGVSFVWSDDWEVTNHVEAFDCYDREPDTCEMCDAYDADGVPVASLCCIDDATPEYRRVVEAELALEAMPQD